MSALATFGSTLPATPAKTLDTLKQVQEVLLTAEQLPLRTEHVIHGGMYARTIRLDPGTIITGALIKVATVLIVHGHCKAFVGDGWAELNGYNVIAASAGRKQLFVSIDTTEITMIFPTKAKTVEEAEQEFTDEWRLLINHREGADVITITGE